MRWLQKCEVYTLKVPSAPRTAARIRERSESASSSGELQTGVSVYRAKTFVQEPLRAHHDCGMEEHPTQTCAERNNGPTTRENNRSTKRTDADKNTRETERRRGKKKTLHREEAKPIRGNAEECETPTHTIIKDAWKICRNEDQKRTKRNGNLIHWIPILQDY